MNIVYYETPVPHIVLQNYYNDVELEMVWKELDFLTDGNKLMGPMETGAAFNKKTGLPTKNNYGLFLDSLYESRNISNILTLTRKHFDNELSYLLACHHFIFEYIRRSRSDKTLISYYEESGSYLPHFDNAAITAILWLYKEPKQFSGGEFYFSDYNYNVPLKNNCMVIFPSTFKHSVDSVSMISDNKPFSGFGRYAITNFIST